MKSVIYFVIGLILLSVGPQLILGTFFTIGIYYCLYAMIRGFVGGSDENSNRPYEPNTVHIKSINEQKNQNTVNSQKFYNDHSYPHYYRTYDEDEDYHFEEEPYYNDWDNNDIPPDKCDGFRATGAPFI